MTSVSLQERKKETRQKHNSEHKAKIKDNSFHLDEPTRKYEQIFLTSHHQIEAIMFIKPAKKIITSFLFLAVSTFWISAQEPDRNVEQRLKDFLLISKHHTPISASADWTATNWITVKKRCMFMPMRTLVINLSRPKIQKPFTGYWNKVFPVPSITTTLPLCRWKADWRINPQYITKETG